MKQEPQGQYLVLKALIELGGEGTTEDVKSVCRNNPNCGHLLRKAHIWGYVERSYEKHRRPGARPYVWKIIPEEIKKIEDRL
jgi:predicted transcriptional regulator